MHSRFAAFALAVGNFVVGLSIVAPTGMLTDLSTAFGIGIGPTGLLVTYGAIVLCFGSPIISGLTSAIDRRTLLVAILAIAAVGNLASAFAPGFLPLLLLRLVIVGALAAFTPQAVGTIALLVPGERRSSAIAFVFLGWSLAVAFGLPVLVFVSDRFGWQVNYLLLAALCAVGMALLMKALPRELRGARVSMTGWLAIARHRQILLLLAVTALSVAGQFATFTFFAPLLNRLAGANAETVSLFFAAFGFAGIVGNVAVTRVVLQVGPFRSSLGFLACTIVGVVIWCLGTGSLAAMAVGVILWGLGFAAFLSMQQARIVAAAPVLAAGSVSLNTSALYVGQALGSGVGGILFEQAYFGTIGYLALGFLLAALAVLMMTRGPAERVA